MNKNKNSERSMFTTIVAIFVGVATLGISLLLLPINNFWEGVTFAGGLLLTLVCALTAYEGKRGAIAELIMSLMYWR